TQLPVWGARIFKAVFGAGPARDAYVRARARGGPTEVVILSATAGQPPTWSRSSPSRSPRS
ncbi:hypothetical protein, partial [Streptomyces anandii]|uniref:hypothetical protein n=1 Tax=Streptomyces anandii TaxID=285454 RepID=UPI001E481D82